MIHSSTSISFTSPHLSGHEATYIPNISDINYACQDLPSVYHLSHFKQMVLSSPREWGALGHRMGRREARGDLIYTNSTYGSHSATNAGSNSYTQSG